MHKTSGLRDPAAAFPLPNVRDDAGDRRAANRAVAVSAIGLGATGLIAGSVLRMGWLRPWSCSGEQIADRGGEDAGRVVLLDLAGPDTIGASVHERYGRCHQPPGGQVRAEGPVCLPALQP